jgi:hypothetical protein
MLKHIPIPTVPTTTSASNNNRSSRPIPINRSQPLNVSTLTTASNGGPSLLQTYHTPLLTYPPDLHKPLQQNGHVPRMFTPLPTFSSNSQQHLLKSVNGNNNNHLNNVSSSSLSSKSFKLKDNHGAREALTSLGLLCLGFYFKYAHPRLRNS